MKHPLQVRDKHERYLVLLIGNPIKIDLIRDANKRIYAICNELFALVKD